MKLQNSHLKALVSLTDKTDTRFYVNQIHVESGKAYASNGLIALRVPAPSIEQTVTFRADKAELHRKSVELIQSANLPRNNKQEQKNNLEIDLTEVEQGQNFPPLTNLYETVESDPDKTEMSVSLDELLTLLKAMKQAGADAITIKMNRKHRPMIVESKSLTGLIVPVGF